MESTIEVSTVLSDLENEYERSKKFVADLYLSLGASRVAPQGQSNPCHAWSEEDTHTSLDAKESAHKQRGAVSPHPRGACELSSENNIAATDDPSSVAMLSPPQARMPDGHAHFPDVHGNQLFSSPTSRAYTDPKAGVTRFEGSWARSSSPIGPRGQTPAERRSSRKSMAFLRSPSPGPASTTPANDDTSQMVTSPVDLTNRRNRRSSVTVINLDMSPFSRTQAVLSSSPPVPPTSNARKSSVSWHQPPPYSRKSMELGGLTAVAAAAGAASPVAGSAASGAAGLEQHFRQHSQHQLPARTHLDVVGRPQSSVGGSPFRRPNSFGQQPGSRRSSQTNTSTAPSLQQALQQQHLHMLSQPPQQQQQVGAQHAQHGESHLREQQQQQQPYSEGEQLQQQQHSHTHAHHPLQHLEQQQSLGAQQATAHAHPEYAGQASPILLASPRRQLDHLFLPPLPHSGGTSKSFTAGSGNSSGGAAALFSALQEHPNRRSMNGAPAPANALAAAAMSLFAEAQPHQGAAGEHHVRTSRLSSRRGFPAPLPPSPTSALAASSLPLTTVRNASGGGDVPDRTLRSSWPAGVIVTAASGSASRDSTGSGGGSREHAPPAGGMGGGGGGGGGSGYSPTGVSVGGVASGGGGSSAAPAATFTRGAGAMLESAPGSFLADPDSSGYGMPPPAPPQPPPPATVVAAPPHTTGATTTTTSEVSRPLPRPSLDVGMLPAFGDGGDGGTVREHCRTFSVRRLLPSPSPSSSTGTPLQTPSSAGSGGSTPPAWLQPSVSAPLSGWTGWRTGGGDVAAAAGREDR